MAGAHLEVQLAIQRRERELKDAEHKAKLEDVGLQPAIHRREALRVQAYEDALTDKKVSDLEAEARKRDAAQGLSELEASPELQAIALDHSRSMAAAGRLTHDGFQSRFDRTRRDLCVENVAAGTTRPATLVAAWNRAPQHRRNLYEPRLRRAGMAGVGAYVTLFACD